MYAKVPNGYSGFTERHTATANNKSNLRVYQKCILSIDSSELGFPPQTIERYSLGPFVIMVSSSPGQTHAIEITSKENKTDHEDNQYIDQRVAHRDTGN